MKKLIVFCCLSMFIWSVPFFNSWAEPIAVIVNKNNSASGIESSFLAHMFMGKAIKWPDGQKIFVVDRPSDSEIRFQFYKIVLNSKPTKKFLKPKSPLPFKPMILKTDASMCKFTTRIPNAIGYIYLSEVNDKVKVLEIDGKLPGDEGYKIK